MSRLATTWSSTRERVIALDLLRILAAVTVVTIHVLAPWVRLNTPLHPDGLAPALSACLHYAVPMFTFLAGALSWGVVWRSRHGGFPDFMRRRWVAIGIPYLGWRILYYLMRPMEDGRALPTGIWGNAKRFSMFFINGGTWYHLYFLPMVFVLYLLTPLASRAVHRMPEAFLLGVYLVGAYAVPYAQAGLSVLPYHSTLKAVFGPLIINVFAYAPYMALGAWYTVRQQEMGKALRFGGPFLLAAGIAAVALPIVGGVLARYPQHWAHGSRRWRCRRSFWASSASR